MVGRQDQNSQAQLRLVRVVCADHDIGNGAAGNPSRGQTECQVVCTRRSRRRFNIRRK
jgi:hypothetical protein